MRVEHSSRAAGFQGLYLLITDVYNIVIGMGRTEREGAGSLQDNQPDGPQSDQSGGDLGHIS